VTNVTRIDEDGVTLDSADYEWSSEGLLRRVSAVGSRCFWTRTLGGVVVTYDHGYADVPSDLAGVCMAMATRFLTQKDGRLVSLKRIGAVEVRYAVGQGQTGLTSMEDQILNKYRQCLY
jgi:hypothetical protein